MARELLRVLKTIHCDKKDIIEGYFSPLDISIKCYLEIPEKFLENNKGDTLINFLNDFLREGLHGFNNLESLDCRVYDSQTFSGLRSGHTSDDFFLPHVFFTSGKHVNSFLAIYDNLDDVLNENMITDEIINENKKYRNKIACRLRTLLRMWESVVMETEEEGGEEE